MSTKGVFTMGFLSILAATGLFAVSNGFAADEQRTSQNEKLVTQAVSGDSESGETLAIDRVDVVSSPPSQAVACKETLAPRRVDVVGTLPLKPESCEPTIEYVSPYTRSMSH
jgi:hypothetical protein